MESTMLKKIFLSFCRCPLPAATRNSPKNICYRGDERPQHHNAATFRDAKIAVHFRGPSAVLVTSIFVVVAGQGPGRSWNV